MRKAKVLFLISRFLDGGIDTVLVEYLSYLSTRDNYEVSLAIGVNMGELEVFRKRLPANVSVFHLVGSRWLCHWRKEKLQRKIPLAAKLFDELLLNPIRRFQTKSQLQRLSAGCDAVVDFDCCFHSYMKGLKAKKIAFFHFSISQSMKITPRRMRRIGSHFDRYDSVVTISKAMYEEAVALFPTVRNKFVMIYSGKDERRLRTLAAETPTTPLANERYIVVVERLEESQKDIGTILRAYKLLRERYGRNERLFIVGKGRSEAALKQLSTQLGIDNDVVFLGFQQNPLAWIARSEMLVHSAKFEGLPTVLIEALLLRKPIVATDCPTGPAEILADGKAGLLVPVGDAEAMAEAMNRVLSNDVMRKNIVEAMDKQAANFSFDQTGKLFDNIVMS